MGGVSFFDNRGNPRLEPCLENSRTGRDKEFNTEFFLQNCQSRILSSEGIHKT